MDIEIKEKLVQFYQKFLTDERIEAIDYVVSNRTRFITVVLEDIFQSQNTNAVLRTCDALGIQDVHIIENENKYKLNLGVTKGCSKWLDIFHYNELENNTLYCINKLKEQGYKIIATTPHENEVTINDYSINEKTAVFFGTERTGVSEIVKENADAFVKIPMYGFSESYNISVSVAVSLTNFVDKIRKSKYDWQLTTGEKINLKVIWTEKTLRKPKFLKQEFLKLMEV